MWRPRFSAAAGRSTCPHGCREPCSYRCAIGTHGCPTRQALVVGARADQAVVVVLLEHVRRPARHAAHREDRREQVDRNAQRIVRRRRIEIDVRVQPLDVPSCTPRSAWRSRYSSDVAGALAEFLRQRLAGASRADRSCDTRDGRSPESSSCSPACPSRGPSASSPDRLRAACLITSSFAPPCSGPFSAPMPAVTAE